MSLRSKVDRAIVAYLQTKAVGADVYPFNRSGERIFPNVTVKSGRRRGASDNSEVKYSGDYRFQVEINIVHEATVQPGDDSEKNRAALDAIVKKTHDALMQAEASADGNLKAMCGLITTAGRALKTSDDAQVAANNADMDEFTLSHWEETGLDAVMHPEGNACVEILVFECVACASNVD